MLIHNQSKDPTAQKMSLGHWGTSRSGPDENGHYTYYMEADRAQGTGTFTLPLSLWR